MTVARVDQVALAAAIVAGLFVGAVDVHAQEVQPAVLLLLLAGSGLGALGPRHAVVLGVLLGAGVPIAHAYMRVRALPLPYPMTSYAGSFLALIPATLGALTGAWLRRLAVHA